MEGDWGQGDWGHLEIGVTPGDWGQIFLFATILLTRE